MFDVNMLEEYERKYLDRVKGLLEKRKEVYTVTEVSRSGLTRWVKCYVVDDECRVMNITGLVAKVIEEKVDKEHWGIKMEGIGYNVPYEVVMRFAEAVLGRDKAREIRYCEIG
jgi:hypothetical protein